MFSWKNSVRKWQANGKKCEGFELLHEEENKGRQETYEKILNIINERKQIQVDISDQREVWPWRKGRAMLLSLEDGGKGPEPRNVDGEPEEGEEWILP